MALFQLERSRTPSRVAEIVRQLKQWLAAPRYVDLRHAFTEWLARVLLPLRLPGVIIPEVKDLEDVDTMLAERVIEWTREWKQQAWEEGQKAGQKAGWEGGLAAERQLLVRQARVRFGDPCAESLSNLLAPISDPEQLAAIGEWIITCPDSETLMAQMRTFSR